MHRKRFDPIVAILSLALLIAVGSFSVYYLSNVSINTGYVSRTGSTPAILVGHFFQDGAIPNEYTLITILNKGSTAQTVTVKFWGRDGLLITSTDRTINPDNQWQLTTGSNAGSPATRGADGYFTIESSDVSKLLAQAYVILPNAGNFPGFSVTITRWQPSGNSAPVTTTTPSTQSTSTDTTLPDTTLTAKPRSTSISTSAAFSFTSTGTGITFECKLDSGSFEICTSPKRYTGLSRSSHTFSVRAKDAAGNLDSTPATYTWSII